VAALETRAAALRDAYRAAAGLKPKPWPDASTATRAIWRTVAREAVPGATDEREQWTIAAVEGNAKGRPHIVLTSTNAEIVMVGEVRATKRGAIATIKSIVDAGLRGFRHER
jgi:hypothetical protein